MVLAVATFVGCGGGGSSTQSAPPVQNPVPTLSSLTPNSTMVGGSNVTITLSGSNFIGESVVLWNGSALASTYVSSTSLTAIISPDKLASAGTASVTVHNPSPGGGDSGAATFTITPGNPVPVLSSINPNVAAVGGSGFTLSLSGSDFISSSTVTWNGSAVPTTYVSATSLTAQVAAVLLNSPGTVSVAVENPTPGGGTSNALGFTVQAPQTAGLSVVNVMAKDLAWDPVNQRIYLSIASTSATDPDSVVILDPATATLGSAVSMTSEPNLLAVSAGSKYLYVGLDAASIVQRLALPSLASNVSIALGSDSYYGAYFALDLQAAPNTDATVAVVRGAKGFTIVELGGVLIYDDATPRAASICGFGGGGAKGCSGELSYLFDSIQWKEDGSAIYAANNESTAYDFYSAAVGSNGFGTVQDFLHVFTAYNGLIHYDATTGYVYDDDGQAVNAATGAAAGRFPASGVMVPDGKLGTAFFLGQTQGNLGTSTYTLESFDIATFAPIATYAIPNVIGVPTHLIRWGTDGLAFTTAKSSMGTTAVGSVYLLSGKFVSSGSSSSIAGLPTEDVRRTWERAR